ncbi:hypothetical protein JL2886_02811 [Phaeobacter gallaeciensis]|uniref:Uncharacterized protein n=1 Tax=Phaeobacter gallaeciensis TaxID=60890 RepID=A0A1B0ZU20_9RHOB|nr:hypothetical protein JL2886_02811 [Phaeobacter gallaeciensis]
MIVKKGNPGADNTQWGASEGAPLLRYFRQNRRKSARLRADLPKPDHILG